MATTIETLVNEFIIETNPDNKTHDEIYYSAWRYNTNTVLPARSETFFTETVVAKTEIPKELTSPTRFFPKKSNE